MNMGYEHIILRELFNALETIPHAVRTTKAGHHNTTNAQALGLSVKR